MQLKNKPADVYVSVLTISNKEIHSFFYTFILHKYIVVHIRIILLLSLRCPVMLVVGDQAPYEEAAVSGIFHQEKRVLYNTTK